MELKEQHDPGRHELHFHTVMSEVDIAHARYDVPRVIFQTIIDNMVKELTPLVREQVIKGLNYGDIAKAVQQAMQDKLIAEIDPQRP